MRAMFTQTVVKERVYPHICGGVQARDIILGLPVATTRFSKRHQNRDADIKISFPPSTSPVMLRFATSIIHLVIVLRSQSSKYDSKGIVSIDGGLPEAYDLEQDRRKSYADVNTFEKIRYILSVF